MGIGLMVRKEGVWATETLSHWTKQQRKLVLLVRIRCKCNIYMMVEPVHFCDAVELASENADSPRKITSGPRYRFHLKIMAQPRERECFIGDEKRTFHQGSK
ncbi:hypothetical protein EVAR_21236_1 [Eumeta japonica]|uniref:Uncharacterized protein n=1 Tax=Eumeta variegata TaxID=151549 RepID=A0A4C1YZ56_EUMVA|nr:hypothetical protein EVAR_21236_1 [Eumeta japonica]